MVSTDFRKEAREKLSGKWGKAVCIVLAYALISGLLSFIGSKTTGTLNLIIAIATVIIEIPLGFGFVVAFVKLFNSEEVGAFDFLKSGFNNFKRSWSIVWYTFLKMIWPLVLEIVAIVLLVIGSSAIKAKVASSGLGAIGIIACILAVIASIWSILLSYYYKLAPVIAADNENMTGKEAVEESKRIMKGKRAKLFFLELSFIGWAILAAFTLGFGFLWLVPYIQFATISFYKYISKDTNTNTTEE